MVMAILLSLSPHAPKPHPNPSTLKPISLSAFKPNTLLSSYRRHFIFNSTTLCFLSLTLPYKIPISTAETSPSKSILSAIANTKSWFQFYGNGFVIRVPPQFEDMTEPEDYNAGLSLYGDKAKTKTFAARFASPDGSEVLSVLIRPSNQLKITFLEAKDITDLGTLKEAAKIFVPGGSTIYSARTIKVKEEESFKTYYFYEFGRDEQHVALVAAVNGGKSAWDLYILMTTPIKVPGAASGSTPWPYFFDGTYNEGIYNPVGQTVKELIVSHPHIPCGAFIAGASAPQSKWEDDGVKLRSAAVSLTVL